MADLAAGSQLGHFEIIKLLGKGGMGEVYHARDLRLYRTVALKIIPAELASDASRMERFYREAKAAASLNHSNICTIHEMEGEMERASFPWNMWKEKPFGTKSQDAI